MVNDPLDDRQAQPGAFAQMPGPAKKGFENAIEILGRDSRPGVLNRESGSVIAATYGNIDLSAARRMPKGIVEDISDQDFDHQRLGINPAPLNLIEAHSYALSPRFPKQAADNAAGAAGQPRHIRPN